MPLTTSRAYVHWRYATRDCAGASAAPACGAAATVVVARPTRTTRETLRAEARAPDHSMATPRMATICSGTLRRQGPRVNALQGHALHGNLFTAPVQGRLRFRMRGRSLVSF